MNNTQHNKIALFQTKQIRKIWHEEQWYFSVVDVCSALTDSPDAGAYWRKLKQRLIAEGSEVVTFCHGLKLIAPDGKMRATDCANTAEISKATFGMTPSEYKNHKNLPAKSKANLRDHMTDLELIFTMLGEKVTTEISEKEKPKGMPANKNVAKRGGSVAGTARKEAEKELGRSVISEKNYLENEKKKSLKPKNDN